MSIVYNRGESDARIAFWNRAWRSIRDGGQHSLIVRFGSQAETVSLRAEGYRFDGANGGSAGLSFSHDRAFLERLANAPAIDLTLGRESLGAVELPNMRAAITRLLQCVELERPPVMFTNLATYLSDFDYPVEARQRREQGTVSFRLTIGPDGRPTECVVTQSSGSAILDETTCRLMRERPRFTPARDRNGNPVSDTVEARIRWRL